jgi:hypothetical protein
MVRAVGLCGAAVSAALLVIAVTGFGIYQVLTVLGWTALGAILWLRQGHTEKKTSAVDF